MFQNRVLRIFGPKRDEVTGGLRKLHKEELHKLYPSPSIIRMVRSRRRIWAGHVTRMGENTNAYRILVENPEGKGPLGGPRIILRRNLRDVGLCDMDWIDLGQDRDQ
jgi:hypothetical protein